jgi:hypothetical protein
MKTYFDLHNNCKPVIGLNLAAIITDTTTYGSIIDTAKYNILEFFVTAGTISDGTYAFVIQDGDASNLSDAADVADDYLLGDKPSFTATDDDTVERIGYIGKKRYVRVGLTSASTASGGYFTITGVLSGGMHNPQA